MFTRKGLTRSFTRMFFFYNILVHEGKFDIDKDVYLRDLMSIDISIDRVGGGLDEGHDGVEQGSRDGQGP